VVLTPAFTIRSFSREHSACRSLRWGAVRFLGAADVIRGYRFVRDRTQLDAIFEYSRPDERYGLLANEHTEEAKKSDRRRCRRPYLNKPIYDSDC